MLDRSAPSSLQPSKTIVILAAGSSTRYGAVKQLDAVGPHDATLLDYCIFDALRAGITHVVLVVRTGIASAMRTHTARWLQRGIKLSLAFQSVKRPDGDADVERQKPWGTAHAVLAARSEIDGSFVVCNADDFYGRRAFSSLVDCLWSEQPARQSSSAVVGYRLSETLSDFGGVSRALCECDKDGFLKRIIELKNVSVGAGGITGESDADGSFTLSGDEIVSTNLWGLAPVVMQNLEMQFGRFLERHGRDRDVEFLLSTAVNEQLALDVIRVRVLPASSRFLGITYPDDKATVAKSIAELISKGHYPADLWREHR